jgi:hypothetical protein
VIEARREVDARVAAALLARGTRRGQVDERHVERTDIGGGEVGRGVEGRLRGGVRAEVGGHVDGDVRGDVRGGDVGRGDIGRGDIGRGDIGRGDIGRGDVGRGDVGERGVDGVVRRWCVGGDVPRRGVVGETKVAEGGQRAACDELRQGDGDGEGACPAPHDGRLYPSAVDCVRGLQRET